MAGYRISHPAIQWTADDFTIVPGGKLVFTDSGGSTPRNVFSDAAATVSLGNELTLNAASRSVDFFMDGEYRVRLLDEDDNQIWLRDNVRDVASGGITPPDPADGEDGQVWATNGVTGYWLTLLALPDPTGSDGYAVVADGDGYSLTPFPTPESFVIPDGGITTAANEFVIGKKCKKWGTGTAPAAASSLTTTQAVVFSGTAFTALEGVQITPRAVNITAQGAQVAAACISESTAGFTASFFAGAENTGSGGSNGDKISSSVPFYWEATGTIA